jgi:hypothetical protein
MLSALSLAAVGAGAAALGAVAPPASPANAAEQIVFELPQTGPGACSESGFIGQTFTPEQGGSLEEFGFWSAARDLPAGGTATATVSVGWWIADGFLPFSVTEDVELPATADPALTMITPAQPASFIAGVQYGIMVDFDGFDACPVSLATSGEYDGGFMVLDENQASGNLALRVHWQPLATEPDPDPPYVAPSLSGTPPAATVGEPYSFHYTVNGSNNPVTALQQGTLPPGITFSTNGLLSGTPTEAGVFTPMLKAYDGDNANLVVAIIEVRAAPTEPDPETAATIEGTPPAAVQGRPYSFRFNMEGSPAPTASVLEGSLPRGLTLSGDALLSGTPTESGTFALRLTAENGVGPAAIIRVELVVSIAPVTSSPDPGHSAAAAPSARPVSPSSATRTLAKSGVEPASAITLAALALLAGGAVAGGAALGRRRRAASGAARA